MIFRTLTHALILAVSFISFENFGYCKDSPDDKLTAYKMASSIREQLESLIEQNQKAISVLDDKAKYYKPSASSGDPTANKILEGFEDQKEKLTDRLESSEKKLKDINGIISQLKNDPDVGSLVSAQETSNDINKKLNEASTLLPKLE